MSLLDNRLLERAAGSVQSEDEILEHFMPSRAGRPHCGKRQVGMIVMLSLAALIATAVFVWGALCFALSDDVCFLYIDSIKTWALSSPAGRQWFSLLGSVVFICSFLCLAGSSSAIAVRVLRWRRTIRLRRRVVSAMSGVTSRSDATRQLMYGMRKVVSLVHDSSLTVSLTFEGISYQLRDGTSILTDASGSVSPDEITVVMGPSGSHAAGSNSRHRQVAAARLWRQQGYISVAAATRSAPCSLHALLLAPTSPPL